jgi:hypothetical protein
MACREHYFYSDTEFLTNFFGTPILLTAHPFPTKMHPNGGTLTGACPFPPIKDVQKEGGSWNV